MASSYGYVTDTVFQFHIPSDNITTGLDTTAREGIITSAERFVNGYVGTSFSSADDVIKAATLEMALYYVKQRLSDEAEIVDSDPTYGVEESKSTQAGTYSTEAEMHKVNAMMMLETYGRAYGTFLHKKVNE